MIKNFVCITKGQQKIYQNIHVSKISIFPLTVDFSNCSY